MVKRGFSALALSLVAVAGVGVVTATPAHAIFQAPYSVDGSGASTTGAAPDGGGCITASTSQCN